MTKRYDRAYFDKWYRSADRVHERGEVRRKVALAIATAEYFLRRRLRSAFDIGCGEGAWYPHLRALRPRISYSGIDASEYVVREIGASRHIRFGRFGDLESLGSLGPFDLVICSDVMHYLRDAEIRRGLPALARMTAGIAFIEVLTSEDVIMGDLEGLIRRPAAWYCSALERAGLAYAGPYCWLSPDLRDEAGALEVGGS